MAKKRCATFSVADHLDMRALIPDVLLFDRLAFPYPANDKEMAYWEKENWNPKQLDFCLLMLEDLALRVDWGRKEWANFSNNAGQAALLDSLDGSPQARKKGVTWETAKQMTRQIIRAKVQKRRDPEFWVMPCYRSREAFLLDQNATITRPNDASRREALSLLVGQKMMVPNDADPKKALRLAIDLTRDESYRKSRRALNNWQETVIGREQSAADDAQELADLISDLNAHIANTTKKKREQWFFFALKQVFGSGGNPLTLLAKATIEIGQIARGGKAESPSGPIGAFQHVRERVIEAL